jgi:hypothetical protein
MNYLVIYPGRFHPFHRGHKASYDWLVKRYGSQSVYIATSDVQAPVSSPFSFADKMQMMTKLGIPAGKISQVKNPYQANEITKDVADPENTALIFAVSEKDMSGDGARFKFGVKKNGEPSYMQPMPENLKQLQPMTKHAYVQVTPTVNFKIGGQDANSASQIRKMYLDGNADDRSGIITDLYGSPDKELQDTFDKKLGMAQQTQQMVSEGLRLRNPKTAALIERVLRLEREANAGFDEDLAPDYLEEQISGRKK